ncbi:ABC transporter substrate-binding protein [Pseudoclavibacter helvolus]
MYGTIVDAEAELLEQSWAGWAEENGIEIVYEGSKEFETQISVRAQGGTPPDVAIFPQPGLMGDLASTGLLTEAPEGVVSNLEEYWSEDWKTYSSHDGTVYGAPLMANLKGFVWYSPKFFKDNGYEVPKTWEELVTLTGEIQSKTGTAPWCAGFGSDAATGWPGTDWIEDLVIRMHGPEVYDQWVANEIPFTDERIQASFEEAGKILTNPDYVNAGFGDVRSINSTAFGDVAPKLVDGTCALHHQASFYDGFITEAGGTVGEDGDVWAFMTPPAEGKEQAVTAAARSSARSTRTKTRSRCSSTCPARSGPTAASPSAASSAPTRVSTRPTRRARSCRSPSRSSRTPRRPSASTVLTSCLRQWAQARSGRESSTGSTARTSTP